MKARGSFPGMPASDRGIGQGLDVLERTKQIGRR